MGRRLLYFALVLMVTGICFVNGCTKSKNGNPQLEPISLVQPDSVSVQHFVGDSVPIQITFTADRPINFMQCLYDLGDSTGITNYQASYPDTLFNLVIGSDTPRVNIYTAKAFYRVPALPSFSVIYFKAFFTSGNSTFTVGQNYPAGVDSASKVFTVNVR